jgi:hypothetical protein
MPHPPFPTGLWRRLSMTYPDGRSDMTTRVLWLQTQSIFADLRVKADRPDAVGFAQMPDEILLDLAQSQGFAGVLEVDGSICRWRRQIDFEPPGGPPDEATFAIKGNRLIETGIHAAYVEVWERVTAPDVPLTAFRLDGPTAGYLVLAGTQFIEIIDRPKKVPPAKDLAHLVQQHLDAGDRAAAVALVDMRINFGEISHGEWRIDLATLPWLEGTTLAPMEFDPETGTLTSERRWTLVDSTLSVNELNAWLKGRA